MSDKNRAESDIEKYIRYLNDTDPLRERLNLHIIKELDLPTGSNGLDVGCGMGTQAIMLANAVGPQGHVTGMDIKSDFLDYARGVTSKKGMSKRISFKEGNFTSLPFDDNTFDWAWSSDGAAYAPTDPVTALKEMARVVKPGGNVIVLFWSSEQLLPGYPLLEAKLKATGPAILPFTNGNKPETHHLRVLAKLEAVGLTDLNATTFVETVQGPLSDEIRTAMTDILEMRWPGVESELSKADYELFQKLTNPDSPDYILNLPDYYGFYTYSVFRGKVPAGLRSKSER